MHCISWDEIKSTIVCVNFFANKALYMIAVQYIEARVDDVCRKLAGFMTL